MKGEEWRRRNKRGWMKGEEWRRRDKGAWKGRWGMKKGD